MRAAECTDSIMWALWVDMADHWRDLGGDKYGLATIARLMQGRRASD
jgi:hypothetical protein